jgi:hypothetical protein
MGRDRWIRGDEAAAFDWSRPARELDVPVDMARALYVRAVRLADDVRRAEALYLRWLRDAAAARRPTAPPPVPGRQTRVMREAGNAGSSWNQPDVDRLVPGKSTRVLREVGGDDARLPGFDDVRLAMATLVPGVAREEEVKPTAPDDWHMQGPPGGVPPAAPGGPVPRGWTRCATAC